MTDRRRFETIAIRAGQDPDPSTGAAVVPIFQTSTFVQEAVGKHKGYEYSRTDNPTRRALEVCLGALEDDSQAIAFASGMAAITTLALTLRARQRVVIPRDVYGGTYRLFFKVLGDFGLECVTADMRSADEVAAVLDDGAGLVLVETPTNPSLQILDLAMLAELSHSAGALLAVDNTFATAYIQQPLDFGADVSVYSATKYMGGHSDLVAGAIVTRDAELAERLRFLQNAAGAVPGPFDAWLLLRGLKTLGIRMRAHCAGAERVAEWLSSRDGVVRVFYPGLPDHPGHDLATKQMAAQGDPLYGGIVSVELDSEERALALCGSTDLFFLAESLGGVESLIEHPARMTHASLAGSGLEVSPGLVRISVGIEHPDDLIADLDRALGFLES
jgi:cystathionine gamma-synthase